MAFLIAFIPALAVYLTSVYTQSRGLTIVAAIIAATIGIFTGNPAFTLYDLAFVGVALFLGLLRATDADPGRVKRSQQENVKRDHADAEQVQRAASVEQQAADRTARAKANASPPASPTASPDARRRAAIQEVQGKMLAEAKAKRRWGDR